MGDLQRKDANEDKCILRDYGPVVNVPVLCFNLWNQMQPGEMIDNKYHNLKSRMAAFVEEVCRLRPTVLVMPEYKPNLQLEYLQELDAMYTWDESATCQDPISGSGGCVKIGVLQRFERQEFKETLSKTEVIDNGSKGSWFQIRYPGTKDWISVVGMHLASGADHNRRKSSLTWIFQKL